MLRQLFYQIGSELFPQGPHFVPAPDDTMLVSYPKSGNTWVRALLSHLVEPNASLARMERMIPDIYTSRNRILRSAHQFASSGRLFKSHEAFIPSYKRVIYVVRDPRDVCISYYHYLSAIRRQIRHESTSLHQFCEAFLGGEIDHFGSWGQHVGSWLGGKCSDFLLVRYEDLHSNTVEGLQRICKFLELDGNADVEAAVRECSIAKLRAKEEKERLAWKQKHASSRGTFFRRGSVGNWSDLDSEMLHRMYENWGPQMQTLGYV